MLFKSKTKNKKREFLGVRDESDIPQLQLQPIFQRTLRFVCASSGQHNAPLNSADLLCALGMIASDSNTGHALARTVKVKKIQIWAVPKSDSDGAWQEAYIDWHNSTSFASGFKVGDVSISNARPLHVSSRPPKESVCNFWMQGDSIQYVTVSVPAGAIIDITVNFTMADEATVSQNILAYFTVGEMRYGKLDQTSGAQLIPVGLDHL